MITVFKRLLPLSLALLLLFPAPLDAGKKDDQIYRDIDLFIDALKKIREKYVEEDKTETRKLVFDALRGMINDLDPYSSFMDPQSFRDMREETRGEFGGLGIEIAIRDGWLTIISPIEGTPADKAGLQAGDKIVKIDGKSTEGITIMEAVHKLRGPKGTKVTVTIARASSPETKDITVTRDTIKIESIRSYLLRDEVGYIRISEFSQTTGREFSDAVKSLRKSSSGGSLSGLIIDLRNNPGGLLMAAVQLGDRLLPKDEVIVSTRGRLEESSGEYRSQSKPLLGSVPLVVLVNGGSASASEILAGAVQDNGRGLVLGEKTFGKASVQTIYPLEGSEGPVADGKDKGLAALRLTTAKYFTPKGKSIHEEGITPDIVLKPPRHTPDAVRLINDGHIKAFSQDYLLRGEIRAKEQDDRIAVDDDTYREFVKYMRLKEYSFSADVLNPDEQFLRDRIAIELCREELGEGEARRLVVEKDPLTNKAVELLVSHRLLDNRRAK